jgi:CheY-like chemotaxis protein
VKILFVDDNHALTEALALYVEPLGHEVRSASNAPEAMQVLLAGFRPHVLLVDVQLRGAMPGDVFIRSLCPANFGRKRVGVVVLTSGSDIVPGLPPTIPILRKPVEPAEILRVLEEEAEGSENGQEAARAD